MYDKFKRIDSEKPKLKREKWIYFLKSVATYFKQLLDKIDQINKLLEYEL